MTDAAAVTRYHFTAGTPSPQLVADLQAVAVWPVEAVGAFGEVVGSYLRGTGGDEQLASFAAAFPPLKARARPTLTSMLHFFSASMRTGGGAAGGAHVQADLASFGLDAERGNLLCDAFLASLGTLSAAALDKTLHVNQLHDINWKFGVSAASSEQAQVGATFLQLQMSVERGEGKKENVLMELSLPQFYQFLQQMQLANRQMQTLSK